MKKLLCGAVALTLIAGAASAQPYGGPPGHDQRHEEKRDAKHDNRGQAFNGHHGWKKGQRLPTTYRSNRYVVNDWRARHLRQPPRGYHWVRADNDYVLAAVATGLIASIIAGR